MRLSEAILLGDSLKKASGWTFFDTKYEKPGCAGCALFGAILSSGIAEEYRKAADADFRAIAPRDNSAFLKQWPWFTMEHESQISAMYFALCDSRMTIEQLADEVRKWKDELGVYDNVQPLLAHDQGAEPSQDESRSPELLQVRREA